MRRDGWIPLVLALVGSVALLSCATRDSGHRISNDAIAFIEPGVTKRSEVVENLGPPLFELQEPRVAAYSWGRLRATGSRPAIREQSFENRRMGYNTTLTPPPEDSGLMESRRWICCLALDQEDRVLRVETIRLEGNISLEEAVRQWASRTQ
jgi:hypothetical protein